jgi:hypothetical protein
VEEKDAIEVAAPAATPERVPVKLDDLVRRLRQKAARNLAIGLAGGLLVGVAAAYLVTDQVGTQRVEEREQHFVRQLLAKDEELQQLRDLQAKLAAEPAPEPEPEPTAELDTPTSEAPLSVTNPAPPSLPGTPGGRRPSGRETTPMPMSFFGGEIRPFVPQVPEGATVQIDRNQVEQAVREAASAAGGRVVHVANSGAERTIVLSVRSDRAGNLISRLRNRVAAAGSVSTPLDAHPAVPASADGGSLRIQELERRLKDMKEERSKLLVDFFEDAPSIRDLDEQMAAARKEMEEARRSRGTAPAYVEVRLFAS